MRVVMAEDEALVRRGLELVLREGGHEVLAAVADPRALLHSVETLAPDLVITDIRMPPTHTEEGMLAALSIRRQHPGIAVVVLSQHVQRRYARELIGSGTTAGHVGYLLKQRIADIDTFLSDLDRVQAGGTTLDPEVVAVMLDRKSPSQEPIGRLTPRQREVLALVAEGLNNASIAGRLFLTEKAVVQHISRIYDTLGLTLDGEGHRRVQAVVRFLNRD
jgi:DNA-binding NarL/FixJ family response regulator